MAENIIVDYNKTHMLSSIIEEYGLDPAKTKLARHAGIEAKECYEKGFIEDYQAIQREAVFEKCTHVLSFIGKEGTTAEFIGLYRVDKEYSSEDFLRFMPADYPYPEQYKVDYYYYDLEKLDLMAELEGKLTIEWGSATQKWHQWARNDKEIISIPDYVQGGYTPVTEYFEDSSGKRITATSYERNYKARKRCLETQKYRCKVCEFSAEEVYGEEFKNKVIEVHHINPISAQDGKHTINPETDLIPVCPNCHTMLHTKINCRYLTWEELKKIVDKRKTAPCMTRIDIK